ncbi:MAG: prephenate dehydrogenase/arogenate dehydrogenase family protein [Dissulfurimicrobium sp.]|uniref:prephenate dehydrogenase/arogenate dehydrogenase family protein n=1 Tax=Dissulfurimicrobium TaxID=1769732 RepID=UPI001EDB4995|nr:prephenate dehydrogenase/arogenate dehydrogenase family protein [Dissulfurimicrobium hydrothermale]UKL14180.1 prephenate dehydrogenase/arogenate dehydrogenase family protein [Dissulfurimicrobium hydrothermale]
MSGGCGSKVSPLVGIIGGHGRMGRWFERFFKGAGLTVLLSDLDGGLDPEEIARRCDVVVLSVPMTTFDDVVRRVGPILGPDAFLTDLCSLKERQVALMLEYTQAETVGTHPLFGPSEESIAGRRVALCPGRGRRWLGWWEGLLRAHGALVRVVDAALHDRAMAWVQALNHLLVMSLGMALMEDGIDPGDILDLSTPSFEQQLKVLARLSQQDPRLYAHIQMANPYSADALERFFRKAEGLRRIIDNKDWDAFTKTFEELQGLGSILCGRIQIQ